jgi:GNAT superfamily N-acetyltransferase
MGPGIDIRRATPADAGAVADVWWRSRVASVPAIPLPVHTQAEVRSWIEAAINADGDMWVASHRDAGPVAMLLVIDRAVDQLYVDPHFAGQGIGSQLLDVAKELRPDGMELWTFQANEGARRFYERHGFEAVDMTAGDNEEGAPDVLYRWSPDPDGAT